ncbi:AlkA N-terminal domain-containing protein [Glutamicibacter sp.]|uniref:DNA-3-methyladenine glycosylase family protein n=1 Tax=Glutamicibacter sp. TaxID=1931995 RepID=UPI0028BF059A|nr:AlkA N-terminal domain-containing protein [Glutamicibacter sp.]
MQLSVSQPFDAPGIFAFFAARAVAGVEVADLGDPDRLRYARTLLLPGGPSAFELTALRDTGRWRLQVELELAAADDEQAALELIGRAFDLDADAPKIDAALAADPLLAPRVAATGGIRVPGTVDPHEIVTRAIVGQQISVKAATMHLGRLTAAVGSTYHSRFSSLARLFPTAGQIAETLHVPGPQEELDPARPLRLPRRSIGTVVNTAKALSSGRLRVSPGANPVQLRAQLLDTPGIGPWTAAYVGMRVARNPDAWLPGDVALVAGALKLGIIDPGFSIPQRHRELERYALNYSPWRSYAAMHLWQAAS